MCMCLSVAVCVCVPVSVTVPVCLYATSATQHNISIGGRCAAYCAACTSKSRFRFIKFSHTKRSRENLHENKKWPMDGGKGESTVRESERERERERGERTCKSLNV